MRRQFLSAAGAALFLAFVAVRMPAGVVGAALSAACHERCALADAAGTLWHGGGELLWRDGAGHWHALGALRWDWAVDALAQGRLAWRLGINGGSARLTAQTSGLDIEARGARMPVAAVAPALPAVLPRQGWTGEIAVDGVAHCPWAGPGCLGEAVLQWNEARVGVIAPGRLGDYRVRLRRAADDAQISFEWHTSRGPLWIEARGRSDGKQLSFAGEAWAEGADKARLETFLRPVGVQEAAGGRFRIRYPS